MQYEFGAYTLDGALFELRRRGAVITVQRRVLDTILCLIENRGRVVTKDDLVSGPWQGAAVTDAALNRAVMLARRAVQQERGDPPCIQTIRGRGFLWTAPVRASDKPPAIGGSGVTLTDRELRVQCVILVGRSPTRSAEIVDSLLSMLPPPNEPQWKWDRKDGPPTEATNRASVDHLADDSMVITLPVGLSLIDQVLASARYASSLKVLLPDAPMVISTGHAARSGSVLSGELIDRAARLLQGSPPGSIRLDTTTAEFLAAQFLIEGDGDERYLTGPRTLEDAPRTVLGKTVPCLGRDRELKLLEDTFAGVVDDSEARAVLLTAPAGGGKTRLRQEFVKRLEQRRVGAELLLGRADSLRAESPFGLVGALVRSAAGVFGGDSLEIRRQKLRGRVSHRVSSEKAERVAVFLGELAGIPFAAGESEAVRAARQDARLMGEQMREAWLDWIEAECTEEPVILMLEDLHWSDLPSVQLVDATLRKLRETRLMVLALARPEVTTRFVHLWEARGLETFALSPLTRRVCENIVLEVLGSDAAGSVVTRVVEQADGNPFFLEELMRGVAVGQTDLPETVVGTVQARLDALGSDAVRVLRAASVFGETFNSGAVRILLGQVDTPELESTLRSLEEREVILPRHAGGAHEYLFHHAIVRDASYATLTGSDRVLGHRLAGQWLEGRGESDAMVLAEHFDRGADRERAAVWFARAAGQALQGDDLDAALARAERSRACGATAETLSEVNLVEAHVRFWRREMGAASASASSAVEHAPHASALWFHAIRELVNSLGEQGRYDEIVQWARAAQSATPLSPEATAAQVACLSWSGGALAHLGQGELAGSLLEHARTTLAVLPAQDPWVLLRFHNAMAHYLGCSGEIMGAMHELELAAAAAERVGDFRSACMIQMNLGACWNDLGETALAEPLLQQALAEARRRSLPIVEALTLPALGDVLICSGRLDDARATLNQATEVAEGQGVGASGLTHFCLSTLAYVSSDFIESERRARLAADMTRTIASRRPAALSSLARALLAQGRQADAFEASKEAMALLERAGNMSEGESLVRLMNAETKMATGDEAGARAALRAARDSLLERAERITDSGVRESFLTRVPDNARTLELAREWGVGTDSGRDSRSEKTARPVLP